MRVDKFPSRLLAMLTIGVLIGVGGSCAVFWLFVAPGNGDPATDAVAMPAATEIEPSTEAQSPSIEDSPAPEPPKSVVRSLDEIASIKSSSEQQLALRTLLSELDEEQVADLLARSQDVVADTDRYDLQFAMIQRLAHLNPSRALSLVLEMDSNDDPKVLLTNIFGDWAHSNLDEAVARARTLSPYHKRIALSAIMQERTDLSDNTIHAIAQDLDSERVLTSANAQQRIEEAIENPEAAWNELVNELQDDLGNLRTLSQVATAWVEKSGLEVLDKVYRSLTNSQIRESLMYRILGEVAKTDPESALKYASTLENDPHNAIVTNVANIWVRSDPRSALRAAAEIEKESVRKAVAETAIRALAYSEPKRMLEEIDTVPADLQETVSKVALGEISRESPAEAAELVAAMPSGSIKTSGAKSVVSMWSFPDHTAALEWILNEPGVEEIRTELLSSIMNRLVRADPELAMSTALAQPIDKGRSVYGSFSLSPGGVGLEFDVISSIASTDVDKAIELLPRVREGSTQIVSFQKVAQVLLGKDEIDKAFDIIQQVPESEREKVYQALSTSWVSTDPEGMLKSLDRFPSKEDRSRAAAMVVSFNEFSYALSVEQIEEAKKHLTEEHAEALAKSVSELIRSILSAP